MTNRSMAALNRRIEILAAHFQGHGVKSIASKFRISEKGVRASIMKSEKSPRITEAANMLITATDRATQEFLEGSD